MKFLLLFAFCAIATLTACGDDDAKKAPLAIENRLLIAADVPEYIVAREFVWDEVDGVVQDGLGTTTIQASDADILEALNNAGFVAGSARVFEKGEGDPKDRVVVIALEFDSDQHARDILKLSADDSELPCLESCAFRVSDVDVDVPGSRAVQRIATAEDIAAIGDDPSAPPLEVHRIVFTDGPYFYFIDTATAPDSAAAGQAEGLASTLYDRVHDAPSPNEDSSGG